MLTWQLNQTQKKPVLFSCLTHPSTGKICTILPKPPFPPEKEKEDIFYKNDITELACISTCIYPLASCLPFQPALIFLLFLFSNTFIQFSSSLLSFHCPSFPLHKEKGSKYQSSILSSIDIAPSIPVMAFIVFLLAHSLFLQPRL